MLAMAKAKSAPRVRVISSKLVYDGPVFQVFTEHVREGEYTGRRDIVRHSGSVVMMALDEPPSHQPRLLLVKQYRHPAKRYLWELPAGRIDRGEKLLAGAKRELLEETGIRAKKWKHCFRFYASPGFLDETMDVFLARELTQGVAQPEEDEQIEVRFFPLDEVVKMVMDNRIMDAKTMAGVLWVNQLLSAR
jgi:ADP-ribose pyrophosphatase